MNPSYAAIQTERGRLVIVTRPSRNARVIRWFDSEGDALRWVRDEQRIRDALQTVNGRRAYLARLIAGGIGVAVLFAWCFSVMWLSIA